MGLVLGVLAGIFVLGVFFKKATKQGAYAGLIVSAIVVIILKYGVKTVSPWSYSIITIFTSVIIGLIVSNLIKNKNSDEENIQTS